MKNPSTSTRMEYDIHRRRATFTFPNGRQLVVGNISEMKANQFLREAAPGFEQRDCCLNSLDVLTRGRAVRGSS